MANEPKQRSPFGDVEDFTKKSTQAADALGAAFEAATGPAVGLGKAVAGAFGDAVSSVNRLGGEINNLTGLTGAASSTIQGLVHATGLAGVGSDQLGGALAGLQSRMYSATTGSVDAILAFGRLGVSIGGAEGGFRKATDVFDDVVAKLITAKNETERTGKATALGLTPALEVANRALRRAGGNAELAAKYYKQSKDSVKEFGAELSGPALKALDDYADSTSTLGLYLQGVKNAAAEPLIESTARLSERLSDLVKKQGGPLRESAGKSGEAFAKLVPQFEQFAQLGIKASPALETLSNVLAGALSGGMIAAASAAKQLEKTFGDLGTGVAVVGGTLFAVFFPVTAAILAAGLAIDDVSGYMRGIPSITGDIIDGWKEFKEEFEFGGTEQPLILRAIYGIGTAIEGISKAWDGFIKRINDNSVLKLLDRAAALTDAHILGGTSERSKKIREESAVETEASKRLSFIERASVAIGGNKDILAKYEGIKNEVRAERSGAVQSLPPSVTGAPNYSAPAPTVPLTPGISYTPGGGYSSPSDLVSSAPVNVSISVNAGLLGSDQAVTDKIKDVAKEAFGDAVRASSRQRGVGLRQG